MLLMVKSLLSASSVGVPIFYKLYSKYNYGNSRVFIVFLRTQINEIDPIAMNVGSGSLKMLAHVRVELSDPEP